MNHSAFLQVSFGQHATSVDFRSCIGLRMGTDVLMVCVASWKHDSMNGQKQALHVAGCEGELVVEM